MYIGTIIYNFRPGVNEIELDLIQSIQIVEAYRFRKNQLICKATFLLNGHC